MPFFVYSENNFGQKYCKLKKVLSLHRLFMTVGPVAQLVRAPDS